MANYFIAVGGTGQNVALAYYRLCKLAGYCPANIYVLDSDLSISGHEADFKRIDPIPVPPCIEPAQRNSFRDLFNPVQNLNMNTLLSVLFARQDLITSIDKGMFGKPSVGSATIMDKIDLIDGDKTMQQSCRQSDVPFANLLQALQSPGNHRVVICGSAMGGTGAGGVPTLAQYLAAQVDRNRVKIVILYFLRYFNIQQPQGSLSFAQISNDQIKMNAESGMCYLVGEITEGVDACVLFGLHDPIDIPYREAQNQEETTSFLYLLAAIIGNNTYYADLSQYFPLNPDKVYAYWIPYHIPSNVSELMLSDVKVYMPNGAVVGFDNIAKLASSTIDFLDIFAKYIEPLPKYSFVPSLAVPRKLKNTIKALNNAMQIEKERLLEDLALEIRRTKDAIQSNFQWLTRLLQNECSLAGQRPQATILSPNNNQNVISVSGEKYQDVKKHPMKFLRALMNKDVDWGNRPTASADLVNPLVIGIRKSINRGFLNEAFGRNINFTY